MKHYLIAIFCWLCLSGYVAAEEIKYITDSFSITMRTGKGTSHKILRSVKTGTKVEILETDPTGYSRIRLSDGLEGWVLSRYLINSPVARDQLAIAKKTIIDLKSQTNKFKQELKTLSANTSGLSKSSSSLEKQNQILQKELNHITKISSNQLALTEENKDLKQKLLSLKREVQSIQQENISLKDSSGQQWFLIGAGVVIGSVILGLILPHLRFRRRQSWSSL